MTPSRSDPVLPRLHCKRLCQESCGPVPMTAVEVAALQDAAGDVLEVRPAFAGRFLLVTGGKDGLTCPALGADGACRGYAGRPMLCRLWGLVPEMACPHGCVPERWLSREESGALLGLSQLSDLSR